MKAYTLPAGNPPAAVRELRQLLLATGGKFFKVAFIKRGTGEPRKMLARLKRTGAERVTQDRWNSQMSVFDVEKREYRTVPLERVVHFRCGGVEWVTEVGR